MKSILIKISGELFLDNSSNLISNVIQQIKEIKKNHNVGIVLGAGNLFRGSDHGKKLGIKNTTAHTAGMVATIINGLVLQDLLEKENAPTQLFSAINCPQVACTIKQKTIDDAIAKNKCLIFVGGTGNPFFTTDTNAILRALQIDAQEVWKATKVEGIYSDDPIKNKDSKFYKKLTYKEVIEQNLKIMDQTAITLAQEHNIKVRVFSIFEKDALIKVSQDENIGSSIS